MKKNFIIPVAVVLLSVPALIIGAGFLKKGAAGQGGHEDNTISQAEAAGLPAEEKKPNDLSMSVREILDAVCEHKLPTYQCEECRHEVGAVKVGEDLTSSGRNPGKGLVRVVQVEKKKVSVALHATGEIKANENMAASIRPRIEGIIRSVNVDIGAQVKKSDPLFTIESAEVGEALGEYLKACSLVELHSKAFTREKALFGKKISPEQDMLKAKSALQGARADLRAAKQRLHALGLSDKDIGPVNPEGQAGLQGILTIRAPLDGTIIKKQAAIGERVEPDTDVMLLANLDTVWVWADIYESDLSRLLRKLNDGPAAVEIRQVAFPDEVFRGKLDYVGATMDEQTRTIKVRVTIPNEKRLLRPGVFCDVAILMSTDEEVLAVPNGALLSDEGVYFIYKHLKDDYYVRRLVKKGREFADSAEILEGILPGELIVSDGAFLLKSDTLRSKMGAGCAD
jgi:cobalt-zinc-cadmium efflux system membrane fusion protein